MLFFYYNRFLVSLSINDTFFFFLHLWFACFFRIFLVEDLCGVFSQVIPPDKASLIVLKAFPAIGFPRAMAESPNDFPSLTSDAKTIPELRRCSMSKRGALCLAIDPTKLSVPYQH